MDLIYTGYSVINKTSGKELMLDTIIGFNRDLSNITLSNNEVFVIPESELYNFIYDSKKEYELSKVNSNRVNYKNILENDIQLLIESSLKNMIESKIDNSIAELDDTINKIKYTNTDFLSLVMNMKESSKSYIDNIESINKNNLKSSKELIDELRKFKSLKTDITDIIKSLELLLEPTE